MAAADDGGYFIAGYQRLYSGARDLWLIRTNAAGEFLWETVTGGDGSESASAVVATSDGGCVIAGRTDSFGFGGHDGWLVRFDREGREVWSRTYGDTELDNFSALVETGDGFCITGYTQSEEPGERPSWLIHTDADGNERWRRLYEPESIYLPQKMCSTDDGGWAIVGSELSREDCVVLRVDSEGEPIWEHRYGESDQLDTGKSIVRDEEGGFFVAFHSKKSEDPKEPRICLVRIDGEGNQQFFQRYESIWGSEFPTFMQRSPNGGVFIAGHGDGPQWGNDALVYRMDANGDSLWKQWHWGPTEARDFAYATAIARDSGWVVAGSFGGYPGEPYGDQGWLLKYEPEAGACHLNVSTEAPDRIARGETLIFQAKATNPCAESRSFDEATLRVSGPASYERSLFHGGALGLEPGSSVAANVEPPVPPGAPLGHYTVAVSVFLGGNPVDANSFAIEVF